jgi:NitT/TauT family transport system substrate-binding protein
MTGAPDLFWYVKNGSSVKSMKDTGGKTFGFSRPGSSTHLVGLALADQAGVSPKMTPSGGISGTRTQVMSDQIDVGWSVPPFNLDMVAKGDIRIIARGSDVPSLNGQTIRVNVVNADYMKRTQSRSRNSFEHIKTQSTGCIPTPTHLSPSTLSSIKSTRR